MTTIRETLSNLSLGQPTVFGNLAAYPLLGAVAEAPSYLTLDEALGHRVARVTEIDEAGSVPELRFVNDADRAVLLLDGEELVGAKQNRVLNITILVAAKTALDIPVTCVERGRWGYRSREFASSNRTLYAQARARKTRDVSMAMAVGGERRADQAAVWDAVSDKAARMGVHSQTEAMADIYEQQENLQDYVQAFTARGGQKGAVFCIGGKVAGMELFDRAQSLRKLYPKLIESYALDAIEMPPSEAPAARQEQVAEFLAEVGDAGIGRYEALGLGDDLRLESPALVGAALEAGDRIVHLLAFPREGDTSRWHRSNVVSLRQRRSHRYARRSDGGGE